MDDTNNGTTEYSGNQWEGEPPERFWHICEVCGKAELLSPQEAYDAGWDYPPKMGVFGVLSQRNCPKCLMKDSLWWRLMMDKSVDSSNLSKEDRAIINRIRAEPEIYRPKPEDN